MILVDWNKNLSRFAGIQVVLQILSKLHLPVTCAKHQKMLNVFFAGSIPTLKYCSLSR